MEPTYLYKVTGLRKVESLNGLTDVVSSVDIGYRLYQLQNSRHHLVQGVC